MDKPTKDQKIVAYCSGYMDGKHNRRSYADGPYLVAGVLRESWQVGYSDGRAGRKPAFDEERA